MISDTYRKQNRQLHDKPGYGSSGHYWLGHILELADIVNARSLIDFGAGKGTLGPYVTKYGLKYIPYDPVTFPTLPKHPADMVVCLDVLEHIEPEHLDDVLTTMHRLTGTVFFANVSTRESTKVLDDCRNAHLIVEDYEWWKPQLMRGANRWRSLRVRQHHDSFEFVGRPTHAASGIQRHHIQRIRGK